MGESVNWNQLRADMEEGTKALEAGDYIFGIVKAEGTVASTGSQMIKMNVEVLDGPRKGRTMFNNVVLSDNPFALKRFFQFLDAVGIPQDVLAQGPSFEQVAAMCQGRVAIGAVTVRDEKAGQYAGTNNIDAWKKLPPGSPFQNAALTSVGGSAQAPGSLGSIGVSPSAGMAAGSSLPPVPSVGGAPTPSF